jgi:hypothetical protein
MGLFGWIGNAFLFAGIYCVGEKKRYGFLLTTVGELLWVVAAQQRGSWDLLVLAIVFATMQAWNWVKWGRDAS